MFFAASFSWVQKELQTNPYGMEKYTIICSPSALQIQGGFGAEEKWNIELNQQA